ncbi:MAG: LVIVD repeat-containing protein [candidate division WOR-3 bacterium]
MKRIAGFIGLAIGLWGCGGGDETPPVTLTQRGGLAFGGNHITVQGNYLYVATEHKLSIVDVSSVATPSEVGKYENTNVIFQDVSVKGTTAFAVGYNATLGAIFAIDVGNPKNPTVIGWLLTRDLWGIYVDGNYAYVAAGDSGLFIYNVTNPGGMSKIASLNLGADVQEIWKSGNYVYLTGPFDQKLWAVDVSTPGSPALADTISLSVSGEDIHISGTTAVVSGSQGLAFVDINNPSSMRVISTFKPSGDPYAAWFDGEYAFTATKVTGQGRSFIAVVEGPDGPSEVASSSVIDGSARDIVYDGNFCYILSSSQTFIYEVIED